MSCRQCKRKREPRPRRARRTACSQMSSQCRRGRQGQAEQAGQALPVTHCARTHSTQSSRQERVAVVTVKCRRLNPRTTRTQPSRRRSGALRAALQSPEARERGSGGPVHRIDSVRFRLRRAVEQHSFHRARGTREGPFPFEEKLSRPPSPRLILVLTVSLLK